ncbi:hypothetical protein TMatcc_004844 [Talaromyces marneffei ATCC 18224]|uniref:uncharacterized protein n=1 Tax=Talaromyces marneffei TaxID=37727 RepID=UPI0012AA0DDC|nr:uncharacterized protein EYB26_000236 [Talaromyces marneffei]QGA12592.1 hypothetical protein EYB26_000236 [Talaromyces marneffei]
MSDSRSFSIPTVRIPPPPSPHSPLRSPKRRQHLRHLPVDEDPLLGKLSPEAILDALAAINAVTRHEGHAKDLLTRSISQASPDDRLLGARAAIAAKRLREWLKELQVWQWPKGLSIQQGKGFITPLDNQSEFWGSLPAHLVVEYEARLEQIRDGMEGLNVDELKEHIMNVHVPGRSRPSSAHSALSAISAPPFTHVQLSDFTAVITATILRALPTLARLNVLFDNWTVRLLVLRQIPGLLTSLDTARAFLDCTLLATQESQRNKRYSMLDSNSGREKLVQLIGTAGSRMDTVLDALEGREDSIPEAWIDRMDALETDFANWVQLTGKMAIEKVWVSSESDVHRRSVVEEEELQPEVTDTEQQLDEAATERNVQTHEDLSSATANEIVDATPGVTTTSQNIAPSPEAIPTPSLDITDSLPIATADTTSLPVANKADEPDLITDNENPKPILTATEPHSTSKSVEETPNLDIPSITVKFEQAEAHSDPPIPIMEPNHNYKQGAIQTDPATNPEVEKSTIPLRVKKSIPVLEMIEESTSEDSESGSVQHHTEPLKSLPLPAVESHNFNLPPETQTEASHATTEDKSDLLPTSVMPTIVDQDEQQQALFENVEFSEDLQKHRQHHPTTLTTDSNKEEVAETSEKQHSTDSHSRTEATSTIEPVTGTVDHPNTVQREKPDQVRAHIVEILNSDVSIPELDAGESSPRHPDSESPRSVMTPWLAPEDAAIKETPQSSLIESPIKVMTTAGQSFVPLGLSKFMKKR